MTTTTTTTTNTIKLGMNNDDWRQFTELLIKSNPLQLSMMATMIDTEEERRKEQRK